MRRRSTTLISDANSAFSADVRASRSSRSGVKGRPGEAVTDRYTIRSTVRRKREQVIANLATTATPDWVFRTKCRNISSSSSLGSLAMGGCSMTALLSALSMVRATVFASVGF